MRSSKERYLLVLKNMTLISTYRVHIKCHFNTQLSTPKPTARKAMTIEMVVQGRVHHKLRPKPKPRAIRTLPRAAMASDREEKHRKHTGPDGCGNVVLIEGEDEEDEDEEKTYA